MADGASVIILFLTGTRYELVDGMLIEMPPESTLNTQIATFLLAVLQLGIPHTRLGIRHQIATHDMPPPALIVEVVSPKQENRDYRHKRSEYAAQCLPEYWIVDTQPPALESGSCDVLFVPSRKSTSPRRICNCGPDRARRMTNPSTTGVWEMLWSST